MAQFGPDSQQPYSLLGRQFQFNNRISASPILSQPMALTQRSTAVHQGSSGRSNQQQCSLSQLAPTSQQQGYSSRPMSGGRCPTSIQPAYSGVFRPGSAPQRPASSQVDMIPASQWSQPGPGGLSNGLSPGGLNTTGTPVGGNSNLLCPKPMRGPNNSSISLAGQLQHRPGSAPGLFSGAAEPGMHQHQPTASLLGPSQRNHQQQQQRVPSGLGLLNNVTQQQFTGPIISGSQQKYDQFEFAAGSQGHGQGLISTPVEYDSTGGTESRQQQLDLCQQQQPTEQRQVLQLLPFGGKDGGKGRKAEGQQTPLAAHAAVVQANHVAAAADHDAADITDNNTDNDHTPLAGQPKVAEIAAAAAEAAAAANADLVKRISSLEDCCSCMNTIIKRDIPTLLQLQNSSEDKLHELVNSTSSKQTALEMRMETLASSVASFMDGFRAWQVEQQQLHDQRQLQAAVEHTTVSCQTTPGVFGAKPATGAAGPVASFGNVLTGAAEGNHVVNPVPTTQPAAITSPAVTRFNRHDRSHNVIQFESGRPAAGAAADTAAAAEEVECHPHVELSGGFWHAAMAKSAAASAAVVPVAGVSLAPPQAALPAAPPLQAAAALQASMPGTERPATSKTTRKRGGRAAKSSTEAAADAEVQPSTEAAAGSKPQPAGQKRSRAAAKKKATADTAAEPSSNSGKQADGLVQTKISFNKRPATRGAAARAAAAAAAQQAAAAAAKDKALDCPVPALEQVAAFTSPAVAASAAVSAGPSRKLVTAAAAAAAPVMPIADEDYALETALQTTAFAVKAAPWFTKQSSSSTSKLSGSSRQQRQAVQQQVQVQAKGSQAAAGSGVGIEARGGTISGVDTGNAAHTMAANRCIASAAAAPGQSKTAAAMVTATTSGIGATLSASHKQQLLPHKKKAADPTRQFQRRASSASAVTVQPSHGRLGTAGAGPAAQLPPAPTQIKKPAAGAVCNAAGVGTQSKLPAQGVFASRTNMMPAGSGLSRPTALTSVSGAAGPGASDARAGLTAKPSSAKRSRLDAFMRSAPSPMPNAAATRASGSAFMLFGDMDSDSLDDVVESESLDGQEQVMPQQTGAFTWFGNAAVAGHAALVDSTPDSSRGAAQQQQRLASGVAAGMMGNTGMLAKQQQEQQRGSNRMAAVGRPNSSRMVIDDDELAQQVAARMATHRNKRLKALHSSSHM